MAKDIFHNAVKIALEKEGWKITHDPYTINIPEFRPNLAIPDYANKAFESLSLILEAIETYHVRVIVYNAETQMIISWKS